MNHVAAPAVFSAPLTSIPGGAYIFLGLIGVVLLGILLLAYSKREPVEDPVRIANFLAAVKGLDWSSSQHMQSLNVLSEGITALVQAEIQYYYRSRVVRRRVAMAARFGAFVFGTLGLLCPLLATANPDWAGLAGLGYLLFAAAAACFTGNELFGGTRGHVRAVTTQYRLESLLNTFVVEWSTWLAAHESARTRSADNPLDGAFALLLDLLTRTYAAIEQETGEWSAAQAAVEAAYRAKIDQQRGESGQEAAGGGGPQKADRPPP